MPQPALVVRTCVECEQDLEHCHGAVIMHFDGTGDCAEDPDCRLAAPQHLFVVSCGEVECGCGGLLAEGGLAGDAWPTERAAAS
jgi:hypothetical protein